MSGTSKTAAVILAAGRSQRAGAFKPLLPLGDGTFVEEAVKCFVRAGVDDVRVVVGYRSGEVAHLLDRLLVPWVFNSCWDRGMLSSVLVGVRSLEPHIEAFFLLPVDIPLVKPGTIKALLMAYAEKESPVIHPRFLGSRGHPPLIRRTSIPEDLTPDHEGGLRAFLERYEDSARDVDVADEGILLDCDSPADYETLVKFGRRRDIPTEKECRAIWALHGTPCEVMEHSLVVAETARLLAVHLKLKGLPLDTDLVVAAGLLHDLAKGKPQHAALGAEVLRELGYGRVADVVAAHTDIVPRGNGVGESELVYLSDKYVGGSRIVPMEERFNGALKRFGGDLEAVEAIQRRRKHARMVRDRIESILGYSVESVLERHMKSLKKTIASQKPKTIYLLRHGFIEANGGGRRYIGQLDVELHADGIRQAEAIRERLRDVPFSTVLCSDLRRSEETARIIAGDRGLEPVVLSTLREINLGRWEGERFEEIQKSHPDSFEERGRDILHFRPPEGESFLDCAHRVIPVLYAVIQSDHEIVLMVGHAGVNRIILCQALGWSAERLFQVRQDYGCLNVIRYENGSFRVDVINDVPV